MSQAQWKKSATTVKVINSLNRLTSKEAEEDGVIPEPTRTVTGTRQAQAQALVLPPTLKHLPKVIKQTHTVSTPLAHPNKKHGLLKNFRALFRREPRQLPKSSANKQLPGPGQLPVPGPKQQNKEQLQRRESKALFVGNRRHSSLSLSNLLYYGGSTKPKEGGGGRGDEKNTSSGPRRHTVPSGYVNVPEFATDVVDDPFEMHSMIQETTKMLYIFWVFIIVSASLLNAIVLFIFRFMDPIFAVDFLRKILLKSPHNYYGVVGVTVSFLILAVWGCVMLSHPFVGSCILGFLRWTVALLLIAYISFCIGDQMNQCMNLHSNLKTAMLEDFNTGSKIVKNTTVTNVTNGGSPVIVIQFKKPRIETLTQEYLECCGVENKEDWKILRPNASSPNGPPAIPVSCCDERSYPGCNARNLDLPQSAESLWQNGCLKNEYTCTVIIMVILGGIEMFSIISFIFACVVLFIVLRHTNELQVSHVHPFGQL